MTQARPQNKAESTAPVLLPQFALAVRGYDRQQVDDYVTRLVRDLGETHVRAVQAERAVRQGVAPAPSGRDNQVEQQAQEAERAALTAQQEARDAQRLAQQAVRQAQDDVARAQEEARVLREQARQSQAEVRSAQQEVERARAEAASLLAEARREAAGEPAPSRASAPAQDPVRGGAGTEVPDGAVVTGVRPGESADEQPLDGPDTGPQAPLRSTDSSGDSGPHPLPLAGLAPPARTATRTPVARRAAAAVGALALVAAVGTGVTLASRDDDAPPAPPAAAPPAPAALQNAEEVPDLAEVTSQVREQGDDAGSAAPALAAALQQMTRMRGLELQARGLSLASDVERAVAADELTPEVQELVRPTLLAQVSADDLPELVGVLAVRPASAGSDGVALLRGLRGLRDRPDPARARVLLERVRTGPDRGTLTSAVRDVAVPVLTQAAGA